MSDGSRKSRIDEIFSKACDLPPDELGPFLDKACGDDPKLRREVERLLDAEQQGEGVLEEPIVPEMANNIKDALEDAEETDKENKAAAADRNLLFVIIAFQMRFISRDQLIEAMKDWVFEKTKPIEEILVSNGAIDFETKMLITALVDKHVAFHGGDPRKSLSSINDPENLQEELGRIDDSEITNSIARVKRGSSFSPLDETRVHVPEASSTSKRFRVLRFHDKGGLGRISVAQDEELNREVAFKEIRPELSDNLVFRQLFLTEAEITGGLEHPGIVPVYGLGTYDDGKPFYAMRFIEGDNLKNAIKDFRKRRKNLSLSQKNIELRRLLRRFIDVCEAVQYAHSRSVLHRDLKPGNIMLGKYGETLVVDWGLAEATRRRFESVTDEGQPLQPKSGSGISGNLIGTPIGTREYMSPEQANGLLDQLGPTTDVYSLGATLYYLLTGQPAFTDEDEDEILRKVRRGEFLPPKDIDVSVPAALNAICLKAMRLKPDQRYASPQELAEDVERWLADEAVIAYRDPWTDRLARSIRQHRTAFATISAIVSMAIVGLILVNALTRHKNRIVTQKNQEIQEQNEEIKLQSIAIGEQNVAIAAKNKDLVEAQQKAESNYSAVRALCYSIIGQAERKLSQMKGMEAIRVQLTDQTVNVFQDLRKDRPEDPKLSLELAQLLKYSANVNRFLNNYQTASQKYTQSIELLTELKTKYPKHRTTRQRLTEVQRDYAAMLRRTGKISLARDYLQNCQVLDASLTSEKPDSTSYLSLEGLTALEFTLVLRDLGLTNEALKESQKAVTILESVASKDPSEPNPLLYLLASIDNAKLLRETTNLAAARRIAEATVNQAIPRTTAPGAIMDQHVLARASLELAEVLLAENADLQIAEKQLARAIGIWQKLSTVSGADLYPVYQAQGLARKAFLKSIQGNTEQANDLIELSLTVIESVLKDAPETLNTLETYANVLELASLLAKEQGNTSLANQRIDLAIRQFEKIAAQSSENVRLNTKLLELNSNR